MLYDKRQPLLILYMIRSLDIYFTHCDFYISLILNPLSPPEFSCLSMYARTNFESIWIPSSKYFRMPDTQWRHKTMNNTPVQSPDHTATTRRDAWRLPLWPHQRSQPPWVLPAHQLAWCWAAGGELAAPTAAPCRRRRRRAGGRPSWRGTRLRPCGRLGLGPVGGFKGYGRLPWKLCACHIYAKDITVP